MLDWHGRLASKDWVTTIPDLSKLSHAEKEALILALFARLAEAQEKIAAQDAQIAALQARLDELTRPPRTPDDWSKPPSQGQKAGSFGS